ncbi:MAG: hypothetical protein L6V35_06465 [Alistipes putredinis]|nr:MAG: hypothetical protein L6V35_06465 [Alistipes putredinis]
MPLSDAEPHYWAGNTKVTMKSPARKSFIIFNGEDRYDIIDAEKMDYHVFKNRKGTRRQNVQQGSDQSR